jgi:hypothetical protein
MNHQDESSAAVHGVKDTTPDAIPHGHQEILEALFDRTEDYIRTSISLFKLQAAERMGLVIATWAAHLMLFFTFFVSIVLFSTAAAVWLGNRMGALHYGFMAIGGVYIFLVLLIWWFGKGLMKRIIHRYLLRNAL